MKVKVCKNLQEFNKEDVLFSVDSDIDFEKAKSFSKENDVAIISPIYIEDGFLKMSVFVDGVEIKQSAITLNLDYEGMRKGEDFSIFEVKGTKCALLVDVDYLKPELYRYLALSNVQVVFSNAFIAPNDYTFDFILRGAFSNIQANDMMGVFVNNMERYAFCQLNLTEDLSGLIEEKDNVFELPTERFYEGVHSFPIFESLNYELYKKELFKEDKNG